MVGWLAMLKSDPFEPILLPLAVKEAGVFSAVWILRLIQYMFVGLKVCLFFR